MLGISVPNLDGIGEKTFLGGGKLSTRALLFFLFSAFALVSSAGGLYIADKKMVSLHQNLEDSKALGKLISSIESNNWRIRLNEKNYFLSKNPKYIDSHKLNINLLSEVLNTLYTHPAAAPVKEHITTINEGLAQYALGFENAVSKYNTQGKTNVLASKLRRAIREVEARVASFRIAHLTTALAAIKDREKAFVNSGTMKDLIELNKNIDSFTVLFASSKIKEEIKLLIMNLFKVYQGNLSQYAKARLKSQRELGRLDEIFNYITPSVNGLISYATSNIVKAVNDEKELRAMYRVILPAGGAAILIAIVLFGLVMLRSIADPVRDVSVVAKRLAAGEENLVIPALGNKDETGDTARALFMIKNKFFALSRSEGFKIQSDDDGGDVDGVVAGLRKELAVAQEKAQKGEAAMAEATQLRLDLESMKSRETETFVPEDDSQETQEIQRLTHELAAAQEDFAKGEIALAEAEQLRLDYEAMKLQVSASALELDETKLLRSNLAAANENAEKGEAALYEMSQLQAEIETLKSQVEDSAKDRSTATVEIEKLHNEIAKAHEQTLKGEAAIVEASQLQANIKAMQQSLEEADEADRLRQELDAVKEDMAKGEAALIEAALLRIDLDSTRGELAKATRQLQANQAAAAKNIAVRSDAASEVALQTIMPGDIASASQQLAKSSQNVSAAAFEAERTGIMIKGLIDAAAKVDEVDALLENIVGQTDFLVLPTEPDESLIDVADSSLVVLTTDYKKAVGKDASPSDDADIGKRFDAIRVATNQAAWSIKDIAGIIVEVKEVASDIASTSSAEALEVTTALLEQSENLRVMLDNLVSNINSSST